MPSNCPVVSSKRDGADASISVNVTELFQQRYLDSPKEDRERLKKCWGYSDCGDCHRSEGHCGWCAISSTCLPLPTDPMSRTFPLLSPVRYKSICALGSERFELRTSGLGCQVSTITFLTSLVTIICTLFGVLVLYGLAKCLKWIRLNVRARKGGFFVREDGSSGVWVRKGERWGVWSRRVKGVMREGDAGEVDDEEVNEDTDKRGLFWWKSRGRRESAERRPLLGR
ncbi:hypothetical protein EJ02DRAFT_447718 [Clathrospora elynae]|uniref:PSI domain-containing protein n=1 Tax=Clathrospora elynae TaxID=706981 RepID=A0A6A5SBT5_9PLEO|nr:hypothetical protein EJ02DRAFT_447718 [Clathrospora elynae]